MQSICPFARSFIRSNATTHNDLPQALYLLRLPFVYDGTSAPLAEYSCSIRWSLGVCVCVLWLLSWWGGGGAEVCFGLCFF